MSSLATPGIKTARIRNFSGGLNIRDAQSELGLSETPDAANATLDERGAVRKRTGQVKYNPTPFAGNLVTNTFYWAAGQNQITQCGTGLFKDTSTTAFKFLSTTARCGMADFQGKLYVTHPVDGLFSYDGSTVAAIAGAPKGTMLAAAQNRLISAGDPANPTTVSASKIGDATDWTLGAGHGWTNQIREKDTEPITCLAGASGVDIAGRAGLLVFKGRSAYRIYDFTDTGGGAYYTIDPRTGAAGPLAVVTVGSRTLVLGEKGIFQTDGVAPLQQMTDTEQPLFRPELVAFDQIDKWCAGWRGDRAYFSLCRAGTSVNNLALEMSPDQGWIVTHTNAASCYSTYGRNDQKLLAGSPTVLGQVYEQLKGGSDDGAPITSYFQTRWFELDDGFLTRLRRIRVTGRGTFALYLRFDFATGNEVRLDVSLTETGSLYDNPASVYGTSLYAGGIIQGVQDFYSLGTCKAVSFRVEETSSLTLIAPTVLGANAPAVGAWALYGLDINHIQLGLA